MERTMRPSKTIAVGKVPRGFSLSPDGSRLFVANSWDDTVSVIDTLSLEVVATWPVGAEPSSVVEDRDGKHLFVANRISNDVAVLNPETGVEEKRLAAGRGASYITPSPDGSRLYVTHVYPNADAASHRAGVGDHGDRCGARRGGRPHSAAWHCRTAFMWRFLPMDGWAWLPNPSQEPGSAGAPGARRRIRGYAHGVWRRCGQQPVEVPLDELERYASRPFGVAITPDKSRMYVTSDGSEIVTVIDVPRLLRYIHTHRGPFARGSLCKRQLCCDAHRGWARSARHGFHTRWPHLLVANRLEDTISVIDTRSQSIGLDSSSRRSAAAVHFALRRADFLHGASIVPGPDRLRQLPHRLHF